MVFCPELFQEISLIFIQRIRQSRVALPTVLCSLFYLLFYFGGYLAPELYITSFLSNRYKKKNCQRKKSKSHSNSMDNLLNELPVILDCKYGHAHKSSTLQDFPYSEIFDTIEVISSFRLMCLTFSAIED